MSRSFLPIGPGKMTQKKLVEMRRHFYLAAFRDWQIFGYRTESAENLRKKVIRAKQELRRQ